MQNLKTDSIEWVAGIFEGEGTIYRNASKRLFLMAVKMKDGDIVKRFHLAVGCGRVKLRKPYLDYAPMWEWSLTKTNDILRLTNLLLPFMGIRRTEQINKAILGKIPLKEKQVLTDTKQYNCGYMKLGEFSSRGAKKHIRLGEKPCFVCAENQRVYLRNYLTFYEVNK